MIEIEKTYLVKELPEGLGDCKFIEIIDIYIPKESRHPVLRVRKNSNKFEITKKEPVEEDVSHQEEQTIILTEKEFNSLMSLDGKKVHKIRYLYDYHGRLAEIDVFQGDLKGLVLADFEFDSIEEKDKFEMPDFCLVDITQEEFIAGGMICGKAYEDIEEDLNKYDYKKLDFNISISEQIKEEAKKFHDSKTGHEWDHVERVHKLAFHIGEIENADLEILELAVFLHDIGRKLQDESTGEICHAEKGAELAKDILKKYNYPEDKINKIIHCIETHRFRNEKIPQTKEAMILFDADHLDGIGAVGIGRAFYFAGNIGSKLHNSDVNIKETKPY
ncbi:MAG: HD domain-containing protein, partial [archaeon]